MTTTGEVRATDVTEALGVAVAALPGGVVRDGQTRMAEAVANAIATGSHLLVQAGTGTGKSLAYIVPALCSGKRVVISTATLALQAQLLDVDLPHALDVLTPVLGRRPTAAVLKGRGNYACVLKLASGVSEEDTLLEVEVPSSKLAAEVLRLREWAERTEVGDRDDVAKAVTDRAWSQVSVSARECIGASRCPHGDECFAERARDLARDADIVVTNHALLALDCLTEAEILPEHDVVVVDEAHELVDRFTDAATEVLTRTALEFATRRAAALVDNAVSDELADATAELLAALDDAAVGRQRAVPELLRGALLRLRGAAGAAASAIKADAEDPGPTQARRALDIVTDTAMRVLANSADDVVSVDEDSRGSRSLRVAPLGVAERLRDTLLRPRTVVATSATLTVGGTFDWIAGEFGLRREDTLVALQPDVPAGHRHLGGISDTSTRAEAPSSREVPDDGVPWRGLDVGSPFDYARQAILYVARDLPPPTREGTDPALLGELAELMEAAGGRTLALFSSMRAARNSAEALRKRTDLPILLQGEEPVPALVRKFRADDRTCLFGTLSLWQGVDVPGAACQLVVIDRIPFPRPDDPLVSARAEAKDAAGESGFMKVSLARAALLMAQGSGRLIRRSDDRGVVAVLDSRLATKRYGGFVRASLPPMWFTTDRDAVLGALRRLDATT